MAPCTQIQVVRLWKVLAGQWRLEAVAVREAFPKSPRLLNGNSLQTHTSQ